MRALAIDIGGTKTAAAVVDNGELTEHAWWPTPSTEGANAVLAEVITRTKAWATSVERCGVSFGGPFDFPSQTCMGSMHVPGWQGVRLSEELSRALGVPVVSDNDANVAALGEYAAAAGTERNPMLYVTLSTGVGSALIINGELLRGAHSLAGELGHLNIGHDMQCNCGHTGCLERAVSGYWIEYEHGISAEQYLADEAHFTTWINRLAQGLWSVIVIADPALIVIGGGMTAQGERLTAALNARIAHLAELAHRSAPAIRLGDPTGRTVLFGAAALAKEDHRELRG